MRAKQERAALLLVNLDEHRATAGDSSFFRCTFRTWKRRFSPVVVVLREKIRKRKYRVEVFDGVIHPRDESAVWF